MRFGVVFTAVFMGLVVQAAPMRAQVYPLSPQGSPLALAPAQCRALNEIEGQVATRPAAQIRRIGEAMEAHRYESPAEVSRLSGLSVPTVTTLGAQDQTGATTLALVFGAMLRQFHPALLREELERRGAMGQLPDLARDPMGMAMLAGLMDRAQQAYLDQCR